MPKFVSAKIAGCKHPVKRKTNDLSKLKYCQSDFKKIVFLRGGYSLFRSSRNVSLPSPIRTITNALESPSSSTADQGYAGSDDGRVVVEVQPGRQTEGGPRRSTRKRNAIVYDS